MTIGIGQPARIEGGDAFNSQEDMRARLFRERSPEAFRIMTDPNPPVLRKAPEVTRKRIYLETMSAVLPVAGRKLIFDERAKGILPVFPLGPMQDKQEVKP